MFKVLSEVGSEAQGTADASAHRQGHSQQFQQDDMHEIDFTVTVPTSYDQDKFLGSSSDVNKTSIVNKYVNPNIASKQKSSSSTICNDILDSSALVGNYASSCAMTTSAFPLNSPARNVNVPNPEQDSGGNYDL